MLTCWFKVNEGRKENKDLEASAASKVKQEKLVNKDHLAKEGPEDPREDLERLFQETHQN